jgi:hypothetical protein
LLCVQNVYDRTATPISAAHSPVSGPPADTFHPPPRW